MLREFKFLRRNPAKNNNTEEAENIPVNPRDSSNPQMNADPSRPPLNTIQDLARIPRGISDHDLTGFKPSRTDRTPTKPKRKYPDTSLRTPEKQGPMSKHRFNWSQKSDYPSTNSVLDTPNSNRGPSRANLNYSECNSAQSTPTKSVSKPPNPGFGLASGSRPVSNMGARMANYGVLSKGIPGSCNLPTVVNTVEVPYFELKEDSSFWMEHNVQVLIRIRPLNNMEKGSFGYGRCLKQESGQSITWIGQPETRFMFDHVACEEIDQETLFRMVGLPMVENCLSGYNSCMFAYGQTGSGKTHTMLGEIEELEVKPSPNRGMTPRIFEFLFARIRAEEESRRDERLMYNCKCSFLEIYNEQITDLLDPSSTNLMLREDMKKGVYVENLSEVEVHTVGDILQLLTQGASNRKVAATNMNRESSRSHSVFTCVIESRWEKDSATNFRFARLNLVDLAGSERQKSSGAEGERLKEAANINKSLSTLGHVIMVLVDVANGKPRHIPYRDSRLTFLLQDSLGGNSKTMIIANVTPSICSAAETLNTLKFAQRAKLIQNNAIINEDSSGDIVALKHQIQLLKDELSALKREKVTRSLAFGPAIDTRNIDEDDCNDNETHGVLRVSCKQLKSLETTLAGALRREQMAEATVQQLQAEIEQLNRLVSQREEDTRCRKMMLKFREDKIQRMESVVSGSMSTDDYLVRENNALHEEIQILRDRIDKNPEVTRFAVENIRLLDQVRQFQDLYEEGEREMLMTEVCELRNQLISSLDGNLKHLDVKGTNHNDKENDLLHQELKRTLSELEGSNVKLNSCLEENAKLRSRMEELHASLNVTTSAIQDHHCSAEVIKESIVEVPMISNPSISTTRSEKEGRSDNLINAEDIMNLQLELDIVKIILQEQRSSYAETEEMAKSLNRELQLSKEMVSSVTKDYEQVLDELKNAKSVIEALESQQIQSMDEIEDLRSSNVRFEDLLTKKELEISNLKELSDLSMYNSPLEAKLKKMHESLEKAKKLNRFYRSDIASHASDENEMEEVRKQVEIETAEVIVCLQEELSGLQQEVYDSKTKETETREKFALLETQMTIMSEDNANLSEQLKIMRSELDLTASEIEDILSGGNEALKDVCGQIDVISSSIPWKRNLIGEQFGKMKKYVFEKELLIEELHRCLKDALDRREDMESMLRSLRGAALVMTEAHQHECSEKDNEIFVLASELNSKTKTVKELRRLIEHGKEQLETASSCATASLVIVNRLWELNLNDKAPRSDNCFSDDDECKSRTGTGIEEEMGSALESLQAEMDKLRCEKEEILASEKCSWESIESTINQVVILGDAIESFRDQFEIKFNTMEAKIGKLEETVQESFNTWFQQREVLEDELDDIKITAAQKSIEASCILEKFEEVQDTVKEADIMINELMIANEVLKLKSQEFKAKAKDLTSERDILVKEVESSKLCYENLEKQYGTDFDIMKRTLLELENVVTDIKNTSVSFDILSVKSQFQESTESIRTMLEDVWSEIIVKDCAVSVLHLCHMGILLETANGMNAENGLLEHGLCESNLIVSELREQNLKSRKELEMCRVLKEKLLADMKKGFDRISSKVDENGSFEKKIRTLHLQEEMMLQRSNDMGSELAVILKEFDLCNKYTVACIMDHERLLKEKDELLEIELHAKEFESLVWSTELERIRSSAYEVFENLKMEIVFKSLETASCELMLLEKENGYEKLLFEFQNLQNELESKNGEFGKISFLEKENEKLRYNVAVLENSISEQEVSQCIVKDDLRLRIDDLKSQLGNVNALKEENILLRNELRAYEINLDRVSCKINNLIEEKFVDVDDKFQRMVNEMDRTCNFLEQLENVENIACKLDFETSSLQMELLRKDDILKGLLFDLSLLQESASNSKDQKDEMEQVLDSLRALENDLELKSIELEKSVAEGKSLEARLQEKEAEISALNLDLIKGEEVINSLSGKYADLLTGAKEALDAKNSMEKDFFETRIKIEDLEMEVAEMEMSLDRMSKTTESLKNNLDSVMCQRDELEGKVVILTNELELTRTLVEENEALASEAQEMAEIEKVHAEEREEEVKLLERSIEELECTINVLEQKVDIVKGEAERQRLQREELEMELLVVKEQMQNIKSTDSDLKRCLDEKVKNLNEALQREQLLEKEIATRDAEISQCKAHISELNVHAEAQASEHKQRFKALEAMVEKLKSEVSTTHNTSSPKRLEKSSSKPRGSGSPFKCIGLGLQIKSEKEEELTAGRQRIEELEVLATSRQKEILMLKARLAATESMTHDVIRDLLGVKLNMKNYANLMDNQQLHLLVGQTQKHNVEAEVKDQEVANLKQQINEFVKERNGWLEEIERKQSEMMAAHVALEKLRQHEQLLATENEMLTMENANHKRKVMELEVDVKKLSGQQNIQQRIHHHAKIKEENNSLKCRNEELSIKLRKTEGILARVKDELSQFRAANGKKLLINFDLEEQLEKKLKETEEEKLQLAQKLLALCTAVLKAAGIKKPTSEISLTVAEEALVQLKNRVFSLEMELEDVKLKNRISDERTRLSELRPQTSTTSSSKSDDNRMVRSRVSQTPFLSALDR